MYVSSEVIKELQLKYWHNTERRSKLQIRAEVQERNFSQLATIRFPERVVTLPRLPYTNFFGTTWGTKKGKQIQKAHSTDAADINEATKTIL